MKIFFKTLNFSFIFILWGFIFTKITNYIFYVIWSFDFLSIDSWNILSQFWHQGGIIKSPSDILFVFSLISLPVIFILGLKYIQKINYSNLIFGPFLYIKESISKKFFKAPERIILKSSTTPEKEFEKVHSELNSIKPEKSEKAENIRSELSKLLNNDTKK